MNKIVIGQLSGISALFFACLFVVGCIHNTNAPSSTTVSPSTIDTDKDGTPNVSDTDIDGDGTPNISDTDMDGDGTPNTSDSDANGDGIPDNQADNYASGLGVVAIDTVGYTLTLNAAGVSGTASATEIVDLNKVRDVIHTNNIALSTFSITDLSIITQGSNAFVQANSSKRIVVKVSYLDPSNNKILTLESAATTGLVGPVLTLGNLASGLKLNKDIFGSDPGFPNFTSMVKDETKASVTTVLDVTFLDEPSQGGESLDLSFILKAAGKKS